VCGNYGDALNDAVFMLGCEKNSERLWWTGYGNYAGFVGHSNDGPCLVWNDAVSNFATPSYYMQKTLFADNQGTRILPFTANTPHCYWSASLDTESGRHDVLLKVVNKSAASETVAIELLNAGNINPVGHANTLQGSLAAENSLADPTHIVPSAGEFPAAGRFDYVLPAYSVSVLRIGTKGDGTKADKSNY
jgi:alpha-L-arabinofuranosidase